MRSFGKPSVIVSKCLGFAHCRYNGLMASNDFVDKLRDHVDFHPVCPELEIGLMVPRNPIRVVSEKGDLRLMQPATGSDYTARMYEFTESFLNSNTEVDGFILKNRSPSCGIKDVKIYTGLGRVASISKGSGFFGGAVLKNFPYMAVEDEGRLKNLKIRDHFLTKLFTLATFRQVKSIESMSKLVQFHSVNKLLLMAYNQKEFKALGKIVANHDKKPVDDVILDYERQFFKAFSKASRYTSNINVLLHALGYFKRKISHREKRFFLDSLKKYRLGKVSLCAVKSLVKSLIVRFEEKYLMEQRFFEPYPEELGNC